MAAAQSSDLIVIIAVIMIAEDSSAVVSEYWHLTCSHILHAELQYATVCLELFQLSIVISKQDL